MDFQDGNERDPNLIQDRGSLGDPGTGEIVLPAGQNVVTLPQGTSIEALSVDGRDLVIELDNGARIVVPDGAVFVPQIVADGVAVPPLNIAQLLTGNEPEPAAGATQSSGGNFADDEGAIQDAFDLGDLLPFTDFGFPEDREEEIIPDVVNEEPEVVIETPDNPIGVQNAIATVDEEGLPARGEGEPEGTNEPSDVETTNGTIVFDAPDGLSAILINGVEITATGQSFTSPFGTLTITSIDLAAGEIGFSYTLEDNAVGEDQDGFFEVTVVDIDGDQATASLSIIIVDDGPIAADDIGIVPAGTHDPITGNVLVNDVSGADDYATSGAVSSFGNGEATAEPGSSLQGQYGVLTLNADGTYTYVRDGNTPGGVEESFTYTIVDQDGSTSTATLVIEIGDAPDTITDVPRTGEGTVVEEGGLPPRGDEPAGTGEIADDDAGNNSDESETTGSTITFDSPDGVASVSINGVVIDPTNLPQTVIQDGTGTLIITGYSYDPLTGEGSFDYEFTLGDNTSGDDTSFDFDLEVVDLDGDTATDTLTITVVDDEPTADDDTGTQVEEDAPITVDVFDNDIPGADDVQPEDIALIEGSLTGSGSVTYNGDGTFTYTPAPGEEGIVTFDYQITDGDADVAKATVTITLLEDSEPDIAVEGDNDVEESGLPVRTGEPAGSNAASDGEIAGGALAISTGSDTIDSLVINGIDVTGGGTVTTASGELAIGVNEGGYTYTYTLTDNTLTDPDSDSFSLTVTDSDGDTANTTLVIAIVDDTPTAADDANSIAAGEYGPVGGNVITNDTQGADGVLVSAYSGTGGSGGAGDSVQGTYGTLTIAADGTYSYIRDAGTPGGVSDTFSYTITDGDGDTSTADLVISIADSGTSLDLPAAGEAGTVVEEDGLAGPPAGSYAASDSELTTGTFTYTAPDGPATITIGGVAVTAIGQTFTGTFGTLTIDAIVSGSITYTYELTTNTSGDATQDEFVVRVTDQDGDFSEDTLEISIVDDVPTANADSDSVTEDGPLTADGNVLTGSGGTDANATDGVADLTGADGATVTAVAFGATNGTVGSALAGTYGQLTLNPDGSYSYALDNQNPFVQGLDSNDSLTEVFTYTITDGDGDTSTTTLTITINGADDPVVINGLSIEGPEIFVAEDDLADGSSPDAAALTQSGSFTVDSPDGLATLTVGGVTVFDANASTTYPVTIDDPVYGLLTITGVTPVADGNGDVVSATIAYTYLLEDNSLLHTGGDDVSFTNSFAVVATDTDGSTDTDSLDIVVIDDVPTANADSDSVTEDGPLVADGNVLTGTGGTDANATDGVADVAGADGVIVTGVIFGLAMGDVFGSVGSSVVGAYGSLVINADGSYAYTLDNTNPLVQGLDSNESLSETFSYTITDGDGDTSTTTVTITIDGTDDPITISGLDLDPAELTVDEDDLADGSSPDAPALTQTGSFTVTGLDGIAAITAGGLTVWTDAGAFVAGQTITTAIGTFEITGVTPTTTDANGDVTEATVTFSYVLNDNTLTHSISGEDTILESFGIEVSDTDGSTDTGSVDVLVIDDIPDVAASGQDAPTLVTDDSDIGGQVGAVDTANFAGLFTTEFGADGAAAADATVYSLSIGGGDGTDSGLNDTLSGENILLRLNGDTIEGYLETSGDLAITLALDPATGDITQTQLRAVVHDDPTDPAETQASGAAETLSANLVSLSATVTDGDGDIDTETIEIGGSFAFEDDGPGFGPVVVIAPFDEDDISDGNNDFAPGDLGAGPGGLFSFVIDFGADGPNANEITASFVSAEGGDPDRGPLALTSGGVPVLFSWDAASNTLTGYTTSIADPVLTMQFAVPGTVTIQYFKSLDHPSTDVDGLNDGPESGYEDDIRLTFNVEVTDGDGDTSSTTLVVLIDDDMAIALADSAVQASENQSFTIDALSNDSFGADGVDTSEAASVFVSTQASQGTVTYDSTTGLFTYTPNPGAGSSQNTSDFFEYTIIDGDGDASTARVDVTLQPDSEPLGSETSATVDDDGLAGNNPLSITGDLNANAGDDPGDTSEASFTGVLPFDVGNDTPATITFDAALNGSTASIGQETVTYSVVGNLLTATVTGGVRDGTDLFTVEITDSATGAYVVTLLDNVLHDAGNDENNAFASIDFTVTDSEGDTALTNLGISFDDDAPTATDNTASVTEGGVTGGNALSDDDGFGVDAAGADDDGLSGAIVRVDSVNQTTNSTTVDLSGNIVLAGQYGTLTINVNTGVYTYDSNANATNVDAQDVFTYTIVDGDGDEATATLTVNIDNVAGQVSDNDVIVNEAGLPTGSDPTSDSEIDADGQITVTGATGTLTYILLSPADGTYGTLVLNSATGEYTYTLDTPFTDTVDENGANVVNGAESFNYEVRDSLNNLIGTGTIDVSIVDDIPTATDQTNINVAEDAVGTIGGNVMTDETPDTEGADGATVTAITIDGNTTAVPQNGGVATINTTNGTYTIDMDGNWTFDPNSNLDHTSGNIDASFTYTLTDGDGDFDTATQPITITDGQDPSSGPDISLALDDQNLADGSTPAGPDSDSDTIVFTEGSDSIASIVFGDTSALVGGLTWVRVTDTQITGSDGARLVVTLDLSVVGTTATVTATLNDNYDDHPTINVDDLVDLGDIDVIATDIDGDTASSTVSVSVSDDLPSISASDPSAGALEVDETDLATDAMADFSTLFTSSFNADNPGTPVSYALGINAGSTGIADVATGQAVVLVLNGGVVEGRTETSNELVFTVTVDAAGMVELDQIRAVTHPDNTNDNEPTGFATANLITLTATIVDSDGDIDAATANIAGAMTFRDDGPDAVVTNAVADMLILDESANDGSDPDGDNGAPEGTNSTTVNFADNFGALIDYGADGAGSVGYALLLSANGVGSGLFTLGAGGAQGAEILLSQSGDTVTGSVGGTDYFTITINSLTGQITFTQLENIWHGNATSDDDLQTLTLDGAGEFLRVQQTVTDRDGDSDSEVIELGNGTFKIEDDGPSVTLSGSNPDLQVSDADLATNASLSFAGAFTFDGGTDGTQGTTYALSVTNGSASGLYDNATNNQVFLFLEAGVVVGREGTDAVAAATGNVVFTVTVSAAGTVTLDQQRAIDHALSNLDGANATLLADNLVQLTATITDNDNDSDSETLNIGSDLLFADDTPTAEPTLTAFLDDDTQTGGIAGGPDDQTPDESNLTGTLVDPTEGFGNDGGTVAFATTGAPAGFQYVTSGSNILIQQDQGSGFITVVTVTLDPNTGAYTVMQNANILHTDDGNNDENEQSFTLSATRTDGDGDTDTTSLTITVDDDTPTQNATNSSGTVDEDGLGGIEGGIGDVPGTATVATGSVAGFFDAGADAPLTFTLGTDTSGLPTLESGGVPVTYVVSNNTLTASAGTTPVFTLVLDPNTGGWTFTLLAPVDHPDGDNENDVVVSFGSMISATDADGDEITSTASVATVTIDDDTPVAENDTNALSEDTSSVGGNILTDPTADNFGADGAGSLAITAISGFGGAGTVGGSTTGEWGSLSLGADGSYTFTLNTAAVQGLDDGETETDAFTYTIQDADGDTSTATLIITINGANDAPVANPDTNWTIEDAASPIMGDVLSNVPHPGAPSGTFADVADTDVDGDTISVSTVGTFNGTYGVLTLNANGTYSYRLYTEAENPTAYAAVQALDEDDTPLTDSFNYTATDGDLPSNATLTISIFGANDAPVVGSAAVATSDEGFAVGLKDTVGNPTDTTDLLTANGTISIADVDDTTFTVTLSLPTESLAVTDGSATGAPISWSLSPDGKTLAGTINGGTQTALTVVIDDTGAFSVTQSLPIFHPDTTSEDVLEFTVDVNVNDGTTTTTQTDAITVELEDDSPEAVVADDMTASNSAGTTATADLDADDDVDNNFGGDGGAVVFTQATIDSLVAQGLTSGFANLSYSISADGTVLTAAKAGTTDTVFTISLDPASNSDEYVLNLVAPLDATSDINFNDGTYDFVGGNDPWAGFVPTGQNPFGSGGGAYVDDDSQDLLLTPFSNVGDGNAINGNANSAGVTGGGGGQNIGADEGIRLDFVVDLEGDPAKGVGGGADYDGDVAQQDHSFDGHYDVNGASVQFGDGQNNSTVEFRALNVVDGPPNGAAPDLVLGTGTLATTDRIAISFDGAVVDVVYDPSATYPVSVTVGSPGGLADRTYNVTFVNDPGGGRYVLVEGVLDANVSIAIFADSAYQALEIEHISGDDFALTGFGTSTISNDPVTFDVPISVTDFDGDVVSSGVLDITLNPATTATTSAASQSVQSFSTIQVSEPALGVVSDNDNDESSTGSGGMIATFEHTLRTGSRPNEHITVAALSGAFLLSDSVMVEQLAGYAVANPEIAQASIVQHGNAIQDAVTSAYDSNVDLTGLLSMSFEAPRIQDLASSDISDGPIAEVGDAVQAVQAQPDQFEPLVIDDPFVDAAAPALAVSLNSGVGVDQAMEALLMLDTTDEASALEAAAFGDAASAILSEIAADALVDELIERFEDPSSLLEHLVEPAGALDAGILDQFMNATVNWTEPVQLDLDQVEAAAAAASA